MEILIIILAICVCSVLSGVFCSYKSYYKGLEEGRAEAQTLVDADGLTKEEKEQLRQVINVLSWGGRNEN